MQGSPKALVMVVRPLCLCLSTLVSWVNHTSYVHSGSSHIGTGMDAHNLPEPSTPDGDAFGILLNFRHIANPSL